MKKSFITILILLAIAISCQKLNNPYDTKYDIDKAAPKDFKIDSINGSSVKLYWEKQTDYSVNYIIDRKVDSSNWVNNYGVIENKTSFTDTSANGSRVSYRLYLKAGTRETSKQETYFGTPVLITNSLSNITYSSATCGGIITDNGNLPIAARGVCWNTLQNPTITNYYTSDGTGNGSFASNLSGLTKNTTYFIRAYATNKHGISYGNQLSFTTNATLPAVTTNPITNITSSSATGGGNVTDSGGVKVTIRGICWSTSPNPTTSNSYTSDGSGIGSFTSSITGLSANTSYYVRAYATNSAGTAYGSLLNFLTTNNLPIVTTNSISNITQTTATGGGNVTNAGAASVTSRGICWSTSQNPTTAVSHSIDGSGTGSFTSSLTGLIANTTYYVRTYARNSYGTSYGNQTSFTSLQSINLPTVSTNIISNIAATTATGGGNVTNDGGAIVIARGNCWSTIQNPTIANSHSSDGAGTGSFISNLTGLTPNTTYYVRSYATNNGGTGYGNQLSFTTSQFTIGLSYGGGYVFYIDSTGHHGLIVAPSDQSSGTTWGCEGLHIITSTGMLTGQANTTAIVNSCSTLGIAARICNDLIFNGYSDWFLPSADEFSLMIQNLKYTIGGFNGNYYWSSSECTSIYGYHVDLNGAYSADKKSNNNYVRAVRSF